MFQNITQIVKKQVSLLMIPNGEGQQWNYLAIKEFRALLRGIASKYNGFIPSFLHSFRTKKQT